MFEPINTETSTHPEHVRGIAAHRGSCGRAASVSAVCSYRDGSGLCRVDRGSRHAAGQRDHARDGPDGAVSDLDAVVSARIPVGAGNRSHLVRRTLPDGRRVRMDERHRAEAESARLAALGGYADREFSDRDDPRPNRRRARLSVGNPRSLRHHAARGAGDRLFLWPGSTQARVVPARLPDRAAARRVLPPRAGRSRAETAGDRRRRL